MDFNAGVVGYPIEHSLSPKIHNAIYEHCGIPWTYGQLPAPTEDDFKSIVADGRSKSLFARSPKELFTGLNVTTPYKKLAFDVADRANSSAELVGFANTLTLAEECNEFACSYVMSCDTTDGEGAVRALAHLGTPIEGARILVLGTGGAAMSVLASAYMHDAANIYVATRDINRGWSMIDGFVERGKSLKDRGMLDQWGFGPDSKHVEWTNPDSKRIVAVTYEGLKFIAHSADIIVDATPLGMNAGDVSLLGNDCFRDGQTVLDAVYSHGTTDIIAKAREAGAKVSDGLPMLVEQALLTISIWCEANMYDFDPNDPANYDVLASVGIEVPKP